MAGLPLSASKHLKCGERKLNQTLVSPPAFGFWGLFCPSALFRRPSAPHRQRLRGIVQMGRICFSGRAGPPGVCPQMIEMTQMGGQARLGLSTDDQDGTDGARCSQIALSTLNFKPHLRSYTRTSPSGVSKYSRRPRQCAWMACCPAAGSGSTAARNWAGL